MTVKEAATIYVALNKLSEIQELSFSETLKILKIKKDLQDCYDIFVRRNDNILKKYCRFDENGNPILQNNQYFTAKSKEDAEMLKTELEELYSEKFINEITSISVNVPNSKGDLTLTEIEALSNVINFE